MSQWWEQLALTCCLLSLVLQKNKFVTRVRVFLSVSLACLWLRGQSLWWHRCPHLPCQLLLQPTKERVGQELLSARSGGRRIPGKQQYFAACPFSLCPAELTSRIACSSTAGGGERSPLMITAWGGCRQLLSPSDKQAVKCAASLPPADLKERLWLSKRRSAFVLLLLLLFWPVNIPSSVN